MLSSVFSGNPAALNAYQMQFVPMERTDWERLRARKLFSNATTLDSNRNSATVWDSTLEPKRLMTSPRRIGDHPVMTQLLRGLTTRVLAKAVLLYLFPSSFLEGPPPASSSSNATAHPRGPVHPTQPFSARKVRSPKNRAHVSVGASTDALMTRVDHAVALQLRHVRDARVAPVSLDDVVPLDEVDGVVSLDPTQFVCLLFLPKHYVLEHPDGGDDLTALPTVDAIKFFRVVRFLALFARWAVVEGNAQKQVSIPAMDRYVEQNIATTMSARNHPLMFSESTRHKILRFMELRSIGPQSLMAFTHMLSTFLEDTFELAFAESSLTKLRGKDVTGDPVDFVRVLDVWRFEEGRDHLLRLLAAFPSLEAFLQAPLSDLIATSTLRIPTSSHREALERDIAALPRRTYSAVAAALLWAKVPLGSVVAEHRAARENLLLQSSREAANARPFDKLSLPPGWLEAFDSPSDECHGEDGGKKRQERGAATDAPSVLRSAVDVFDRVAPSADRSASVAPPSTLEAVLLTRWIAQPPSVPVGEALSQSSLLPRFLREESVRQWESVPLSLDQMRPVPRWGDRSGTNLCQAQQDAISNLNRRHIRALERAKRKTGPPHPQLFSFMPSIREMLAPRSSQPDDSTVGNVGKRRTSTTTAFTATADACEETVPSAVHATVTFDPESELRTSIPELVHLTPLEVFQWFHDGPPRVPLLPLATPST